MRHSCSTNGLRLLFLPVCFADTMAEKSDFREFEVMCLELGPTENRAKPFAPGRFRAAQRGEWSADGGTVAI